MLVGQVLLSQLPWLVLDIAACVVAVLVIKGPARWWALGGLLIGGPVAWGVQLPAFLADDRGLGDVLFGIGSVLGLLGYALLAVAVISGRFWATARARSSQAPQPPSPPGPTPPGGVPPR